MTSKNRRRDLLIDSLKRQFPVFANLWQRFPENVLVLRCEPEAGQQALRYVVEAINPVLENILGAPCDALVGLPIGDVLPPSALAAVLPRYDACCRDGEPLSYEEHCVMPDLSERHWTTLLVPAVDPDGRVCYLLSITHDITAMRQAQAALQTANLELERRVAERTAALTSANAQLRELATRDCLTGFYNRRHFFELAERELELARRGDLPMSVLMLDLDRFKAINDNMGYSAGDQALREIADVVRQTLRSSDIIGRYSGEEFSILLPDTEVGTACTLADRLRSNIAQMEIPWQLSAINCTVSVGLAHFNPDRDRTVDSLIDRADRALLRAKSGGRNQLVVAA